MKRILIAATGIAAIALLAVGVAAKPGPMGGPGLCDARDGRGMRAPGSMRGQRAGHPGGERMMMRRMMALDLSSEQTAQVREIRTNTQKQIIPKRAAVEVMHVELRELMHVAQPNERSIASKVSDISDLREEIQMIEIRARLAARGVLTPEQLERFLDPTWRPAMGDDDDMPAAPMGRGGRGGQGTTGPRGR